MIYIKILYQKKYLSAFSLIEMLITLAIMGILALSAVPVYSHYIIQTRRIEAETTLVQLANALEDYFVAHTSYLGADLGRLGATELTASNYYKLALQNVTASHYQLSASPTQIDELCGTLTLEETGKKGATGRGKIIDCW